MKSKLSSILVALDSSGSVAGLKAAAELAYKTGAELKALYVEDAEWFEASRFSFIHQISGYTGEVVPFDEKQIADQSRALATRLKNIFINFGELMKIRYSYQSVRGIINSELLKAASDVDLLVIRRNVRTVEHRNKLSSTACNLAEQCSIPVLIWNNGPAWPNEFIGICMTSDPSSEVISWTTNLGDILKRKTRLYWNEKFEGNEEWINALDSTLVATVKKISEAQPALTPEILRYYRNALFVIRRKDWGNELVGFLQKFPNSVLLL